MDNKKVLKIALHIFFILTIPILFFEYFVLWWYWGGDGIFNLRTVPFVWLILVAMQLYIMRRLPDKKYIKWIIVLSIIYFTPILTCITVDIIASLLGIDNEIAKL